VEYLEGGVKPEAAAAEHILWEYLNHLSFDKCEYHAEVMHSLFRRPPVRIPAVFYGYQGKGESFGFEMGNRTDHLSQLDKAVDTEIPPGNTIGFRVKDGTNIRFIEGDRTTANFQHGRGEAWSADERMCVELADEDWLAYEFTVQENSVWTHFAADLRISAVNEKVRIAVSVNGERIGIAEISGTSWETTRLKERFKLDPGEHRIVLKAEEGSVRIEWIEVKPCK
jgi:hypothetical protein